MQKAAQSSQLKNGNLGGGRVYAFRVARINADFVCLKLWLLGGVIRARNIAVAALPALIEQIDAALADGCEVIALDGAEFSATKKVLSGIRNEFSYCCIGGVSDAKNVHGADKAALPQSESLRSTKPKASAPATEQARYISPLCAKGGSDCTAPSASQVRSACGAEVLNDGGEDALKQPKGWRKCAVENPPGAAIRTKRGRTSVVVGVRKIAKFQPKTKGKSK